MSLMKCFGYKRGSEEEDGVRNLDFTSIKLKERILLLRRTTNEKTPGNMSSNASFYVLLSICVGIRLCCLMSRKSYYVADEYWQSLEVAHKLVFGYGYITWEWVHGIRSYIYVSWIAIMYKVLQIFRIDTVQNLIMLPCVVQAFVTAVADTFFIKWVLKVSAYPHQAYWSAWCYMTNVFLAYCATRTLTNTLETNLTCIGLYLYPWFHSERGSTKYFWIVCLSCVIRPTSAIQWAPLCLYELFECQRPFKTFISKYCLIGLTVLTISTLLDSYMSGRWVLTWWNFLVLNVFNNISSHYSSHSVFWYFIIGLPIVLGPSIVPFYVSVTSTFGRAEITDVTFKKLATSVLFSLLVYSFIPHKEFRFLLPLIPSMVYISSFTICKWISHLNRYQTFALSSILLLVSVHIFYYLCELHQVGTIKVMEYLNRPENNLLFLMPCHLTPLYSHLHINITTRFLRCDPNFDNNSYYLEESTRFYNNPMMWLDREYPLSEKTTLPTHLICFDVLEPIIETFLSTRGYKKWFEIFHGNFVPPRVGHYVVVYNKTAPLNFQY